MRRLLVLLLALMGASARAGEDRPPSVRIDLPAAPDVATPLPVVDLRGVVTGADRLSVSIETKERTLSFEAKPGVTIAMTVDVAGAIASGRVGAQEKPEAIREETAAAIRTRLRRIGAQGAAVETAADGLLVARIAASDDALLLDAARFVPMQSSLEFRVQVLPAERMPDAEEGPKRRIWTGTEAEFDAFLASEVARWKKAVEGRQPYIPSQPRWRVVPRKGSPRAKTDDFALVEEPAEERFRFDGSLVEDANAGQDERGMPLVNFRIRDARQAALRAFTAENVGQHLGILIDGELWSAPLLQSVLSDAVQITLGVGSPETQRAEAERLAVGLSPPFVRAAAAIVAVVERAADGAFEAFGPLASGAAVTWTLRATSSSNATSSASRRVVHAPAASVSVTERVAAQLARVKLGSVDADDAAGALLADAAAATPPLLADLRTSPFAANRIAAARVARRFSPEATLAPLLDALDDPRPAVRVAAARSIGRLGPAAAAAVPKLVDLYLDSQGAVREEARDAIEAMGKDAVAPLTTMLSSEDPFVRRAAVELLSSRYEPAVARLVIARIVDEDPAVRAAVASRLGTLFLSVESDPEVGPLLLRALKTHPDLAFPIQILFSDRRLPPSMLAPLRDLLDARDAWLRRIALYWLGTYGPEASGASEAVRAALSDPDREVRLAAAVNLFRLTSDVGVPLATLRTELKKDDAAARADAAGAIGELGPAAAEAAADLAGLLDAREGDVSVVAAIALFRLGVDDARARAILEAVRKDPRHRFHREAVDVLEQADEPR